MGYSLNSRIFDTDQLTSRVLMDNTHSRNSFQTEQKQSKEKRTPKKQQQRKNVRYRTIFWYIILQFCNILD